MKSLCSFFDLEGPAGLVVDRTETAGRTSETDEHIRVNGVAFTDGRRHKHSRLPAQRTHALGTDLDPDVQKLRLVEEGIGLRPIRSRTSQGMDLHGQPEK